MIKEDPVAQKAFEQRITSTQRQRQEVLKRYGEGKWLHVAPPEQLYERLRRKGMSEEAEELVRQMPRLREIRAVDAERQRPETASRGTGVESFGPVDRPPADAAHLGQLVHEALIGNDDIKPVRFLHRASDAARSVGRVVFSSSRGANGSGFLVGPGLLLTNHHVLPDVAAADGNLLQLEYAEVSKGAAIAPVEFSFEPGRLFCSSPADELDFSLVAVQAVNTDGVELDRFGWLPLINETGKAAQGQRVNIVHHPDGRPQQVSLRENFLALKLEKFLHYMTDTMPGSSGAPVFNDEWEVIALHHAAREITDPAEIELYRNALGSNLPRGVEPESSRILVNEGARISQILHGLCHDATIEVTGDATLIDRLKDAPVSHGSIPHETSFRRSAQARSETGRTGRLRIEPDGSATWTIPLCAPVPIVATDGSSRPINADERRRLELYVNEVNQQKSVLRALSYLQERREGAYLPSDAELDQARTDYYGDLIGRVANDQISPADLYDELSALVQQIEIASSFPESVAGFESLRAPGLESRVLLESDTLYDRSRAHLYTWVDLQPNRMLKCVYTDTVIAPEQLMLRDVLTRMGLDDLLPQRYRNHQYLNCEHIVPQSWFDEASVPRADLHHLVTADGQANNFRSDRAYRVLDLQGTLGPDDRPDYIPAAGRSTSSGGFEPALGRGLVARATLYFLLAHPEAIESAKYPNGALANLRLWANEEAPSDHEQHRNQSTFDVQGNRNPLIDFPQWVDRIDFGRGLGA